MNISNLFLQLVNISHCKTGCMLKSCKLEKFSTKYASDSVFHQSFVRNLDQNALHSSIFGLSQKSFYVEILKIIGLCKLAVVWEHVRPCIALSIFYLLQTFTFNFILVMVKMPAELCSVHQTLSCASFVIFISGKTHLHYNFLIFLCSSLILWSLWTSTG